MNVYDSFSLAVIIPVFNVEQYLSDCLNSLIAQSFQNWIAIVIDDGSTDHSGCIADTFAEKDTRFHIIHTKNNGHFAARNTGLDYLFSLNMPYSALTYLDADDMLMEHAFSTAISHFIESNADIVCFGYERLYEDGKIKEQPFYHNTGMISPMQYAALVLSWRELRGTNGTGGYLWSKLFSMQLVHTIRFPESRMICSDEWYCLAVRPNAIYFLAESLYIYRQREGSHVHSVTIHPRLINGRLLILSEIANHYSGQREEFASIVQEAMVYTIRNVFQKTLYADPYVFSLAAKCCQLLQQCAETMKKRGNINLATSEFIHYLASAEGAHVSSSEEPVLTIILPVYNCAETLYRCLDSIVGQDFERLEVICVYRESTDNSLHVIKKYSEKDRRISIIECGSVTAGGAKNAGIQNMHGEFCMFMSSDACFSSKDVCALIAEGFEAPIDSLWFKAEVIGNEKKALALSNTINSLPAGILKLSDKQMLATGQYIWHKAFRAVNFKIHNIAFPENECDEDVAFHFNWFSLFRNISVIDGCHLKYYINKNSVEEKTARKEEGMGVRYISSLDPIFQFWNKYDLLDRRKKFFTSLVSNFTQLAIKQSPAWEQCRCLNEITRLLRQWNIQHENVWLRNIQEGRLQIHIGDPLPDLQTMMVKTDELHTAVAGFSESQAQNTAHAESILQNVYQTQKVLAESLAQNSTDTQRALQDVQREQKELARIMKGTVLLARHSFFAIKIKRALYGMLEAVTVGRVKIKYSERKKRVDALLTDMKKARWFLRR